MSDDDKKGPDAAPSGRKNYWLFKALTHHREAEEYFYKKDRELVKMLREQADRERAKRELEQRRAIHWMKCPKCGSTLQEVELNWVKVDRCPECGGVFFDQRELEIFLKMQKKKDFLTRLAEKWQAQVAKEKYFPL